MFIMSSIGSGGKECLISESIVESATMSATARKSDPPTSWEAANSVTEKTDTQQHILKLLEQYGPLTDERIYDLLIEHRSVSDSGARTRRRELCDMGLVIDSGKKKTTRRGRKSIMWDVPRTDQMELF